MTRFYRRYRSLLFLLAAQLLWIPVNAQESNRLELLNARTLENITRNGVTVKRLVGEVKFKRGQAILTCDLAEFDERQNETRLNGNVRVVQGEAVLTSENGVYHRDTEILKLTGNARYRHRDQRVTAQRINYQMNKKIVTAGGQPVMMDSTRTLTAHNVTFFENDRYGYAIGEAELYDHINRVNITGGRLQFYPDNDSLLASGDPQVTRLDSLGKEIFSIAADSLSVESDYFFAWGNVRISHQEVRGSAGQAVLQRVDNYAILKEDPVLIEGDYILRGDVIQLNLENDELRSVFIPKNPSFMGNKFLPDTAFVDRLTGKEMGVDLVDNKVQQVILVGMATSKFHAVEDSVYRGLNVVSGDTLTIFMQNDEVNEIHVVGGSEGTYTPAANSDLEDDITYKAEVIRYNIPQERTFLLTGASVYYEDMSLVAGEIDVDWRQNLLTARSQTDTMNAEDYPRLEQMGQKPLVGKRMVYNMRQDRGQVVAGRTEIDEGYYYGQDMQRIRSDVYHVHDGYYTTCDIPDHPHYYFYSKRMKLITDKLVIAKPVVLYIADVPLAILPFAVFPQQKGRRSGFLMPGYDYKISEGRSLKGLGYYWAISDYMDAKLVVDFYDRYEDFLYRGRFRYKLRYILDGTISGSLTPDRSGQSGTYRWDLAFNHNHTVDPTMSIRGSGRLTGDANFGQDYYQEQDARLQKNLQSNLTLNKRFEGTKNSMSANLGYTRNLQVGQVVLSSPTSAGTRLRESTLNLPSFSFSHSSSNLFPSKSGQQEEWYNKLLWNYSTRFNNTTTTDYESYAVNDSTLDWRKETESTQSMDHSMALTGATSLFGILTASGNVSYRDNWAFRYEQARTDNGIIQTDSNGVVLRDPVEGFLRRGTFSTGVNLNTTLYGLFPLNLGPLNAIRHKLTPNIGLRYAPDFSRSFWGYVQSYPDSAGATVTFDPYRYSSIGATPANETFNLNWSLKNEFDYKLIQLGETPDADPRETKGQLFTWQMSGSYNMAKDSLRASEINNNGVLRLGKLGSLNYSARFEIYERDSIPGNTTNSHLVNRLRSPRLTSASVGFGFAFKSKTTVARVDTADTTFQEDAFLDSRFENRTLGSGSGNLWDSNFSFNYSYSQADPFRPVNKNFWVNTQTRLNLTKFWKLSYNARFDLVQRELVSHDVRVTRDLHCWSLKFTWRPSGYAAGYYLLIQVDASQLKDLKLQHRSQPFRR
ncbi:MAG: hypothetical protein K9N11_02535 [Lentisphaeria bacterium]|nr:hypothetical protein [Candidatus Neomarinimicrobiota bacterium]MCF7841707.1 hypothetical protein [Lentisphaeria bacterium]